jgi:SWI/SNF-related matrix-associated actin-dependent regulator of chromatin subfamily A-like protein 1
MNTQGQLLLADKGLVAVFPYDPAVVEQIKKVRSSKWDPNSRVWRIPIEHTQQALQVAIQNNWWVDPDIASLNIELPNSTNELKIDNGKVYLSFPYDPVKVRRVKKIPGVTWDTQSKGWTLPVTSISEAVTWAEQFSIPVSEQVYEYRDSIAARHNTLVASSRETDADIQVGDIPLLPYQRAGVKYAANARRCFIADDMGLGKTIQAIATLEHVSETEESYPAVVVCPPTLVLNWAKEYEKWLPHRKVAMIRNRKDFPTEPYDVLIVGYSNIKAWENQLKNHKSYVLDESHYCKSPEAQRTKAAIKIVGTASPDSLVLCLTGTPVTNKPAEYAPQLQILGKISDFGGRWGFYRRYCNAFRDKFGQWNIDGNSNLDELNERLRGSCYIRRTKSQVLSELPEVRHNKIVVDGSAAGMREYRKAEQDIVKYLMERARQIAAEIGESPGSAAVRARMRAESNEHLVKISVLRKLAARAKIEAVNELVESLIEAGNKVVIAAHHRDIVDDLASRYGNLKIQGGMNLEDVEAHKAKFQDLPVEDAPTIVLSIQAAKTGHTLTASQDVVFVELPWSPADVDQTYSRCHRLGQKGSVTSTYILCADTIDEKIYGLIERKRGVVDAAVDGEMVVVGTGRDVFEDYLALSLS